MDRGRKELGKGWGMNHDLDELGKGCGILDGGNTIGKKPEGKTKERREEGPKAWTSKRMKRKNEEIGGREIGDFTRWQGALQPGSEPMLPTWTRRGEDE
jgi:hypothetical protein